MNVTLIDRITVMLGIACTLLMLTTEPHWTTRSVALIRESSIEMDQTPIWRIPLVTIVSVDFFHWPFWSFCCLAAALVTVVARQSCGGWNLLYSGLFVVGTCLSIRAEDLLPCLYLGVTGICQRFESHQDHHHAFKSSSVVAVCGIAALLTTIDFTLPLLFCLVVLVARLPQSRYRPEMTLPFGCLVAVVGLALFFPGVLDAGARPVSWWWTPEAQQLIPELRPVFHQENLDIGRACLAGFMVESMRRALFRDFDFVQRLLIIGGVFVAVLCTWYVVMVSVLIASLTLAPRQNATKRGRLGLVAVVGLASILQMGRVATSHGPAVFLGGLARNDVDVQQWDLSGSVLLTNLSHSRYWQTPHLRERFPLLLDDRWDRRRELFAEYVRVVDDLRGGHRERYITPQGKIGGFAPFFRTHEPTFVVVDSEEFMTIRHLSVDPELRVIAIDQQKTILANHLEPRIAPMTGRAGAFFLHLEWPRRNFVGEIEAILNLGHDQETIRVARVLLAMRFPYATLRVSSSRSSTQAELTRLESYLELSHRVVRQAGQISLLDQARALRQFERLSSNQLLSHQQEKRFQSSLARIENSNYQSKRKGVSPAETRIRKILKSGRLSEARELVPRIQDDSRRLFFEALLTDCDLRERSGRLQALLSVALPDDLLSETFFYLGCISIELGENNKAGSALQRSIAVDPNSPFNGLASTYLIHLSS